MKNTFQTAVVCALTVLLLSLSAIAQNPIIRTKFTADPCALVVDNTVYVYTGHDEASTTATDYVMNNWHVASSKDMVNWTDHGQRLSLTNFSWANAAAFASHVVPRNGKFYWYTCVLQKPQLGYGPYFGIGVAVADNPLGPFIDALGKPLIRDNQTSDLQFDIDPCVFIDTDGQAYMYWGNATNGGPLKMVKLKANMTEIDGAITTVNVPAFTEAPYLHKRNNIYYLSYASGWPETIAYATSNSPLGPWTARGTLNGRVSSETNHQSIIDFKGQWYFVYHNAGLPTGGNFRRSVCIDYLYYNADGTIKKIVQTTTGVKPVTITGLEGSSEGEKSNLSHLDTDSEAILEYEVYDFMGKKIKDGTDTKPKIVSSLPEGGSYIIRIKNSDMSGSFKIVKY